MAVGKDLTKFVKKMNKLFKQSESKKIMLTIGTLAKDLIVKRSRLGYGVKSNDIARYKLPPLKKSYVDLRKDVGVDSTTAPRKSNITATGQLLRSIKVKAKKRSVFISPSGRRKDSQFGKVGKIKTNKKLAVILENSKNRSFNYLSTQELKQLRRQYRKLFGDLIRRTK